MFDLALALLVDGVPEYYFMTPKAWQLVGGRTIAALTESEAKRKALEKIKCVLGHIGISQKTVGEFVHSFSDSAGTNHTKILYVAEIEVPSPVVSKHLQRTNIRYDPDGHRDLSEIMEKISLGSIAPEDIKYKSP